MKCPICGCGVLDYTSVDFTYMIIDVDCVGCGCVFKLRIEEEPFDIKEADD